ncbi:hypothetical protein [Sphingomonas sp. 1P08PE]|uniref:hypothetical protein n=1 Tax=Sphingomonas sp. 1P08PE TaxID=554122 RepID=UPI00399EF31F
MLNDKERGYYARRAEKELLMAAATENRGACASHYALANLYLNLASAAEAEEKLAQAE